MKCSFEIPTAHIRELKEHQEFDFVLAHMWASDVAYREAYQGDMVMDNGAYELAEPLDHRTLVRIVAAARPRVVIAPDWLDDVERTVQEWKKLSIAVEAEVAGVVVGRNIKEMTECYKLYLTYAVEIVCLPFRLDRVGFLLHTSQLNMLDRDKWYHFLGLKNMTELRDLKAFGLTNTSIDTSKPIKAAIYGKTIHDDLRGLGHIDLSVQYEREVVDRMRFQMDRFREEAQS